MTLVTGGLEAFSKIGATWYKTHIFTASNTATVTEAGVIRYLVVAGGGGGGNDMGGGGGAGGVLNGTVTLSTTGPYVVTVGAGGNGAPAGTGGVGTNGGLSRWHTITSLGGGYGASQHNGSGWPAGSGGSGGGGSGGRESSGSYGGSPGSGTAGQGFDGRASGVTWYPGGGGGAGQLGQGGGSNRGHGGSGKLDDILGVNYYWGGGGGGSGYSTTGGDGGIGGGGGGAVGVTVGGTGYTSGSAGGGGSTNSQTNTPGGAGGQNTGGGGGGGSHYTSNNFGGAGGSGIVVLSYAMATPPAATGTGGKTFVIKQSGLYYRCHVFTQSGNFETSTGGGIEFLVVAGGGSGGARYGGGGGGGGVQYGVAIIATGTYTVTVGAGAVGAQTDTVGSTGSNSVLGGINITAFGGGAGGGFTGGTYANGGRGGSGGGGGTTGGTASQHFAGGARSGNNAGGGGGAGGVGSAGGATGGAGGIGITNTILGGTNITAYRWGAGGGGGASSAAAGAGGEGGGGGGGASSTPSNAGTGGTGGLNPGQAGTSNTLGANNGGSGGQNTGSGGGGGGERDTGNYIGGVGGNGGSGIVIIKYEIAAPLFNSGTGGTETIYELNPGEWYRVHTFTTDSTFVSTQTGFLQYLIVGGGGGGGVGGAGGGGAGGLDTGFLELTSGTYTVKIGQGGVGASANTLSGSTGTVSSFHTITVQGGGGASSTTSTNTSTVGGSGAGGSGAVGLGHRLASGGIVDQGQKGGDGYDGTTNSSGGGGGGYSTPGTKGSYQLAGRGGDGILSSITGTNAYFAGGGGGGINTTGTPGSGGLGGGGFGGIGTTSTGKAATPNTGGGGGGGGPSGGNGANGVVILAYPINTPTVTTIVNTTSISLFSGLTITPVTPIDGTGGVGPRQFGISPSLPNSLLFNISNGQITGSVDQNITIDGSKTTTTYEVTVTDSLFAKSTGTFTLTVTHLPSPVATGGTTSTLLVGGSNYRIHRFNSSDNFSIATTATVEYLIVGAGGGGGSDMGGGGGAGGMIEGSVLLSSGTYSVIVGAGGAGGPAGIGQVRGGTGGSSSFNPIGFKGHSLAFDGAGDAISVNSSAVLGTQVFCFEGWIYNHRLKNSSTLVTTRPNNSNYSDAYHVGWDANGTVSLIVNGVSFAASPTGTITTGTWQHVAVCRNSSNNIGIFVNGVRTGFTSTVANNFTRTLIGVGDFPTTQSESIDGFISNARITAGHSIYDPTQTSFTVPTQPLTATTGTIMLVAQDYALQDNSGNAWGVTSIGNTAFSHFNPFNNYGAAGGGGGASEYGNNSSPASSGASGGGTAGGSSVTEGRFIPGQGTAGATGGGNYYPGGGGGRISAGLINPAHGGAGKTSSILGTTFYWSGGGAGAGYSGNPGNGGLGGGGGGAPRQGTSFGMGDTNGVNVAGDATVGTLNAQTNVPGGNGGTNTGGGGGGGSHYSTNNFGGTGGSGIVVLRYKIIAQQVEAYLSSTGTVTLNYYIPNSGVTPVSARYGSQPYSFSISPGLPNGLSFNQTNGQITGQPLQNALANYTVTVIDASSATSSRSFLLLASTSPLYALSLSAETALSLTIINQVPFKDRSAPRVNFYTPGSFLRPSQRDFEFRSTTTVLNFNIVNKTPFISSPGIAFGYNSSTFANIATVNVQPARSNIIPTFASSSTNTYAVIRTDVLLAERVGQEVRPYESIFANTKQVSNNLYISVPTKVTLDSVPFDNIISNFQSSSTNLVLITNTNIFGDRVTTGKLPSSTSSAFISKIPNGGTTEYATAVSSTKKWYTAGEYYTTACTTITVVYSAVNSISFQYDPIAFNFTGKTGWSNPNTILKSQTTASVGAFQFVVNPRGRASLNNKLNTATDTMTRMPVNIKFDAERNGTVISNFKSTSTNTYFISLPIIVLEGRKNNIRYNMTASLMVSLPYSITFNSVANHTVPKNFLSSATFRYAVGSSPISGQGILPLQVNIIGQAPWSLNVGQNPEPLRFIIADRSQELMEIDGVIEQINDSNDPRLVEVRIPIFVEGSTGQPSQLWFG